MLLFTSLFPAEGGGFANPSEDPEFTVYGDGGSAGGCGSLRAWEANNMMAQRYQVPAAGLVVSLGAWCHANAGSMRMALYTDSASLPDALLAETPARSITGASAWEEFPFDSDDSPAVAVNDFVWICVQASAQINSCTAASAVALARRIKTQSYASGLLNPFGTSSTYSANRPLRLTIWTNP